MEASGESSPRSDLKRIAIAVALVIAAVIVALIVFDEEELSRAEFLERGDEICSKAHDEFTELQADRPQTASQAAELTARLVDISEQELDDIDDLNGPSELDEPLGAYLSSREDGIEQIRNGFDAAGEHNAFAYATAQAKVASEQLGRLELARAVGFEICSRPVVSRAELKRQSEPPG